MANQIVTVNVSQRVAPTPSNLQQSGALISQGGTTLASGADALLTQASDLTPLLAAPITLASLSLSGTTATAALSSTTIASGAYNATTGLVTLTLSATLGIAPGDLMTISGATGTGSVASIDGTFRAGAGTSGTTLVYSIAAALTLTITGGNAASATGLANGATFLTTIGGANPSGYNGTVLATVTSATTFTYIAASGMSSPATGTPTFTPPSVAELQSMVTTFFAQGANQAVYVLELGGGTPAQGVTALTAYITANPGEFYAFLVPKSWAGESTYYGTMLPNYTSLTSKLYFYTTMTTASYVNFPKTLKCVFGWVDSPTAPVTEFGCAAYFRDFLANKPSTTNKVGPAAFTDLFGLTPYPTKGNSALLATLKAAKVNYAGTGSEGGISDVILLWGTMMDGAQANYWYSVDWIQINIDLNVSNAVINGSNNKVSPLLYNQPGIDALQQVAASTVSSAVAFGLSVFPPKQTALDGPALSAAIENDQFSGFTNVNAVPFIAYSKENPDDYDQELYAGFSINGYVPQIGFISIVFNIQISQFVS